MFEDCAFTFRTKKRRDSAMSTIQQHRDYIFMVENYIDYDIWDVQNYET